jgi:hypothetical protein
MSGSAADHNFVSGSGNQPGTIRGDTMTHQLRLRIGIALAAAIAALTAGMGVAANAAIDAHVLAIHCSGGHSTPVPGIPHDGCGG